jgi:hypothetical protein
VCVMLYMPMELYGREKGLRFEDEREKETSGDAEGRGEAGKRVPGYISCSSWILCR